jgi:hypothetical protein
LNDSSFSRFIIDPRFDQVLEDLSKNNIHTDGTTTSDLGYIKFADNYDSNDSVFFLKEDGNIKLNPSVGPDTLESEIISAYDESLMRISALEGSGFFISHSLVLIGKELYLPLTYLTFDFFTGSKTIADGNNSLTFTKDPPELASKNKYIQDRKFILNRYTPDNSFLLIDGPLIGGQITEHNLQLNKALLERNVMPIFFVKNSDSALIINSNPTLRDRYNSDFEWAYKTLQEGHMTGFAKYIDKTDSTKRKNKVFSYLKAFDTTPIRIEMHDTVYAKIHSQLEEIMSTLYYLLLAQGDKHNPQPRPIAIAERYAREALKVIDFESVIHKTGIKPTMNFTRFGW